MTKERRHVTVETHLTTHCISALDQYNAWDLVRVIPYRDSMNGAHVLYVFERDASGS